MSLNWNWLLVVAGALMILLEVALGGFAGFDLVLLGSALAIGGAVGLAAGSATTGFVVASVLCVVYIALGRRWVRARLRHRPMPSNVDALLGAKAVVTVRLSEHEPGQVKVHDETWRARPAIGVMAAFEAGAVVTVEAVDGVTLLVK
jgi:membrane protein implicated in regulation of membrane protease activity